MEGGSVLWKDVSYVPWDAAYFNTHLIRALDWNDTYLSLEPAHPSDNIGALLAVCGLKQISGKEFLTALVVAYDIQCRFCDAASLRARGWDHVAYVNIASTLALSKLLGLTREQTKHAVALALNPSIVMRQVRVGSQVSMEKGASAAEASRAAMWGVMRALCGMTGPKEIFEGQFGFINQVSGPLRLEAFEELGKNFKLPQTYIKLYPVEYHAQAVVEAAFCIRQEMKENRVEFKDIERITIESYEAARTIIGDPPKRRPKTKESADHSIFYILAVALLEGKMTLNQYRPELFTNPAVLVLIDAMSDVMEVDEFNRTYYNQGFPVRITVITKDGRVFSAFVEDPKGHPARPMSDGDLAVKFSDLCSSLMESNAYENLMGALRSIEDVGDMRDIEGLWRIEHE
jgi:2-methylcitrate dehydratase